MEDIFIYWIDIVGTCNLRCPSCAVGNSVDPKRFSGLMDIKLFEKVIQKIVKEQSARCAVGLYNWAEPFLHPRLPEFIEIINSYGLFSMLSGNFNRTGNLEQIIRAKPNHLRVSLSGFYQQTYSRTHQKGDINVVKNNLYKLRRIMDELDSQLMVEVCYHKYLHNMGDDFNMMKLLCKELNFSFNPIWALFAPYEKLLACYEDQDKLTEEDKELIKLLVISPEEAREVSMKYQEPDCELRSGQMSVNADGSVPLCCAVYDREYNIAGSFLDFSHEELQKRKYSNPTCKSCMAHGINMTYIYGGKKGCYEINQLGGKNLKVKSAGQ